MNHHMTSHVTDHVTEITSLNWKERRQFYKTHGAVLNFGNQLMSFPEDIFDDTY